MAIPAKRAPERLLPKRSYGEVDTIKATVFDIPDSSPHSEVNQELVGFAWSYIDRYDGER
jgi:hypothetical protein